MKLNQYWKNNKQELNMQIDTPPPYLVQTSTNTLVAHIQDGNVLYMEERLKSIMQKYGINIPPSKRKDYEEKSVVYLKNSENSLFERAFRDVYFHLHMPKNEYNWLSQFDA